MLRTMARILFLGVAIATMIHGQRVLFRRIATNEKSTPPAEFDPATLGIGEQ